MWPKEIRSDLRAGMKAKHFEDFDLSERYMRRYDPIRLPILYVTESMSSGLGKQPKPYR